MMLAADDGIEIVTALTTDKEIKRWFQNKVKSQHIRVSVDRD